MPTHNPIAESVPSRRRAAIYGSLASTASLMLSLAAGLVLVPWYVSQLGIELYGAWLATGGVVGLLAICDTGIGVVAGQWCATAYGRQDRAQVGLVAGAAFALTWVLALVMGVLAAIAAFCLPLVVPMRQVSGVAEFYVCFGLVALSSAMALFVAVTGAVYNALLDVRAGAIWTVAGAAVSLGAGVGLLWLHFGLYAIALPLLIRNVWLLAGNVCLVRSRLARLGIEIHYSRAMARKMARVFGANAVGAIGTVLTTNAETLICGGLLGAAPVTMLSVTNRAPSFLRTVSSSPFAGLTLSMANLAATQAAHRYREMMARIWRLVLWVDLYLAAWVLAVNPALVRRWVGPDVYAGDWVNLSVAAAIATNAVARILYYPLYVQGFFEKGAFLSVLRGAVLVAAGIVGARYWGLAGLAFAPTVATLAYIGATLRPANALLRFSARQWLTWLAELFVVAVAAAAAVLVGRQFSGTDWTDLGVCTAATALGFGGALFLLSRPFRTEFGALADWGYAQLTTTFGHVPRSP